MKPILILAILFSIVGYSAAQEKAKYNSDRVRLISGEVFPSKIIQDSLKSNKIYLSLGPGYPWSVGGNITYISKKNLGVSMNIKYTTLKSKNLPTDYRSSFWDMYGNPRDKLLTLSLLFVKEFSTSNPKIRTGIEAGISLIQYSEARYTPYDPGWGVLFGATQNYNVHYSDYSSAGISLRGKVEFPLAPWTGFEIALSGNINRYRSYVGIEVYWMIGRVRDRINPKY